MGKYRRVVSFFGLYFILAGFLIWGTIYDDKYALESYNPEQGKNIYRNIIDEGILTVNEIEYGVYEIQLMSKMPGVKEESNKIIYDASAQQYIFNIDQMNNIAIEVFGERGRIVPAEAISALYNDLDIYETTIQTATSSTLDIRTTTLTHLTALQAILAQ